VSAQLKVTPEFLKLCHEEAARRATGRTNKELADLGGVSPLYAAQIVAKIRRQIEHQQIDVSCGTSASVNSAMITGVS
jgi:hypothetical protein